MQASIPVQRLLVILLLASFCVQTTGYHLYFGSRQAAIKKAARKRVRRKKEETGTERFSFALLPGENQEQPVWVEADEFSFRGKMYDVITKSIEGGRLIVHCVPDHEETKLKEQYKEILQKDFDSHAKKKSASFVSFLKKLYATTVPGLRGLANLNKVGIDPRRYPLAFVCNEVIIPPPEAC